MPIFCPVIESNRSIAKRLTDSLSFHDAQTPISTLFFPWCLIQVLVHKNWVLFLGRSIWVLSLHSWLGMYPGWSSNFHPFFKYHLFLMRIIMISWWLGNEYSSRFNQTYFVWSLIFACLKKICADGFAFPCEPGQYHLNGCVFVYAYTLCAYLVLFSRNGNNLPSYTIVDSVDLMSWSHPFTFLLPLPPPPPPIPSSSSFRFWWFEWHTTFSVPLCLD